MKTEDPVEVEKLLNLINKEDLASFLGPRFQLVKKSIMINNDGYFTAKLLKKAILADSKLVAELKKSEIFETARCKLETAKARMSNGKQHIKAAAKKRAMTEAKELFLGCLATRIKPEDYLYALSNYRTTNEFSKIKIIPKNALQYKEYIHYCDLKDNDMSTLLQTAPCTNYLPPGLRSYMLRHPEEFEMFLKERDEELKFLRQMKANLMDEYRQKKNGRFNPQPKLGFL
jgi:hypothetical protein